MSLPAQYSFTRYLAAKKSLDDRSLNKDVWQALKQSLPAGTPASPLRVLEVGAGIGTMIERLLEWGLLQHAVYTALDAQTENIHVLSQRLIEWSRLHAAEITTLSGEGLQLQWGDRLIQIDPQSVDVFDFFAHQYSRRWDLLIAHAFLDLVHIPSTLPQLFRLLRPQGWFYLTVNFDGLTLFEPQIDPALDQCIQALYHRTMDERLAGGRQSGDSQSGRHLFENIRLAGGQVLASGASDWVVFPGQHGYPGDEAYLLHHIVHTVEQALTGHPELNASQLEHWLSARHDQIERQALTCITHQLDFFGQVSLQEDAEA